MLNRLTTLRIVSKRAFRARPELKTISLTNAPPISNRFAFASMCFGLSSCFAVWLASTGAAMMEKYDLYTPDDDEDED